MSGRLINAVPLSAAAFRPFGDVIEIAGRPWRAINDGTCERYDDLAGIDVTAAGGRPLLNIFRAAPRSLPLQVRALERHPLSSQAFYPLQRRPFLIVVATDGAAPVAERIQAFHSSGEQGVNFRRNTWHHPLIALQEISQFLVIDRGGPEENCEESAVDATPVFVTLPDP